MPDWYVRRNGPDNPYPYAIRLGGCEYSLTEEEWIEYSDAIIRVRDTRANYAESEDYQDLVISSSNNKRSLSEIMKHEPREPMKRRI